MNCIVVDDEDIARTSIKKCVEQADFLNLVGVCENAVQAAALLEKEQVDLIFLDIEMPEMSGIEFIRNFKNLPQVILITSREEFAIEAFENNVTDYIVKPVEFARFFKAVNKAKKIHESMDASKVSEGDVFIKQDARLVKLSTKDIYLVEALADYVNIYTEDKRHTILSTMKAIENKLPEDEFARVHRSYIIRLDKIKEIEDNTVSIHKKLIPVSRSYKDNLMNRLKLL